MSSWTVRRRRRRGRADTEAGSEFVIEESLGYLLQRAAKSIARQFGDRLARHDVSVGQWAVLMFLWARDGINQTELSRLVAIEPPTMVRTLDRMERDGLVTRSPDPRDGRASRIHLTERGWALRDRLVPEAVAVNTAATAQLTAAEERTLRLALRALDRREGAAPETEER